MNRKQATASGKQGSETSNKGGRPAKFNEPRRPVTMTLPNRVLDLLADINRDRAKAIATLVEQYMLPGGESADPVRELPVNDTKALLTVADCPALRAIPWLSLVEIAPGRHLVSVEPGTSIEKLELAIVDLLESTSDPRESRILQEFLRCLREPRRSQRVKKEAILVVDKE